MRAWTSALAPDTVLAGIPTPHLDWITRAPQGSRLAYHETEDEWGHIYPDVPRTPPRWVLVAAKRP